MSSPAISSHSRNTTLRIPRRKRREERDDTLQIPRKRSKIDENRYSAGQDGEVNGKVQSNGHVANGQPPSRRTSLGIGLAVREKSRQASASFKHSRADGGAILSKTDEYTVKQLPGLPDKLRKDAGAFRAFYQPLSATVHVVVATTANSALIWDYNSNTPSPLPTIISLPIPVKPTEKLPLAAILPIGTTSDVGLVIAHPSTGKIWHWQNIDAGVYTRSKNIVEGSIKLMTGETIEQFIRVEHGGFMLELSSGRLAYLSLTDANNQPAVGVSLLSNDGQNKGGWLGSLRATLGGGWRNAIAGIQTRPHNNRFETIAITQEGMFKIWKVQYSGIATFAEQVNIMDALFQTFVDFQLVDRDSKSQIRVVDFALTKKQSQALIQQRGSETSFDAIVLTSYEDNDTTRFALAHVGVAGTAIDVSRISPIHVFAGPSNAHTAAFRLVLPEPGHTAFITMPNAVIIASLERVYNDARNEAKAGNVQDILYFKYEQGGEIIATAPEFHSPSAKSEASSLLLFTKALGAARVVAEKPSKDSERQELAAKSKIEQAVFYGQVPGSVLDLDQSAGFNFAKEKVQKAVLNISNEILTSSHPSIPESSPDLERQIQYRVACLRRLIEFTVANYSPVSRSTRWQLLWDAEKMQALQALWKIYEKWLRRKGDDEKILFPLFIASINAKNRGEANPEVGEVDPVRHWFIHDTNKIDKILEHLEVVVAEEHKNKSEPTVLVQYLREVVEVASSLFSSAYEFRASSLQLYGLQNDKLVDGVLQNGYEELAEPWTARANGQNKIRALVIALFRLIRLLNKESKKHKSGIKDRDLKLLCQGEADLVYTSCRQHIERYRWLGSRNDEEERAAGERLKDDYRDRTRPEQMMTLAHIGCGHEAMDIAEKLGDMEGLVKLCVLESELTTDPAERQGLDETARERLDDDKLAVFRRLEGFVNKYGEGFADEFYTAQIVNDRLADLLTYDYGNQDGLTRFLRAKPEYFKLGWINEVTLEKNLLRAASALTQLAQKREPNFWAKRAESSLAKLSLLAVSNHDKEGENVQYRKSLGQRIQQSSARDKVHEDIYAYLRPYFQEAIDDEASIELALATAGDKVVKKRGANKGLLREAFTALYRRQTIAPEVLIDVLTLMDTVEGTESRIGGKQFLLALQVLQASGYCEGKNAGPGEVMRGIIWKRLFVRDDWAKVHATKGKRDVDVINQLKSTLLFSTLKEGQKLDLWSSKPAYTLQSPESVLGAGSTAEELASRFPADLAAPIASNNAADDTILQGALDRCGLAQHYEACLELAQIAAQDAKATDEARRAAVLNAIRDMREVAAESRGITRAEGWEPFDDEVDEEGEGAREEEEEEEEEEEVLGQDMIDAVYGDDEDGDEMDLDD